MGHKRICDYDNARCQIKRLIQFEKFQFVGQFNCKHFNYLYANCIKIGFHTQNSRITIGGTAVLGFVYQYLFLYNFLACSVCVFIKSVLALV